MMGEYVKVRKLELTQSDAFRSSLSFRSSKSESPRLSASLLYDYPQKIQRTFLMGINLVLMRQFIGGNTLVTFSGLLWLCSRRPLQSLLLYPLMGFSSSSIYSQYSIWQKDLAEDLCPLSVLYRSLFSTLLLLSH